jgi:hypothetical protein
VTPDEQAAWRDHISLSLARDPAGTILTLTKTYSRDEIREAQHDASLVAPIPDEHKPGEHTCNWCDRTAEHAADGFQADSDGPGDHHCADEQDCDRHRQRQLAAWAAKWAAAEHDLAVQKP